MRRATRGNVVAAIAVLLAMAGVTWTEPSLAETIVDVATFAQLKAAVHDKTSGPSTLRITNDIYYPTDGSVPSDGIRLKYAVRIVGACSSTSLVVSGTVAAGTCMLDAKEVDRHFNVKTTKYSTAEVVFEKLALVNGKKTGNYDGGGAVDAYETGATRFEDVIFKDNTVPDSGGAVGAHDSGKATFNSCRFIGNKSKYQNGGAVYTEYTASSFTACSFENNEAQNRGGAVDCWGSSSTFTSCTFKGNRALDGAWAGHNVFVEGTSSSPSSASFYACTFLDLLSDPNHGVRKNTLLSSFTFYDNAPPLPPGMVLPPPSLTYSYRIGSWSSCSSSCGEGIQTRSVTCYRSDGQSVSDSYCSESKPLAFIAYQSCNTQGCAKKKGNAAGIAVGVIFAVIVLCVAPWAWSYYRRKVAKDDRDDTVYDMVPVQVAKAQENCLEDFFFFGRKKPSGGGRKFHTMDYAVPPGSNTLAPILVTVPDGMPGAGQELQWKKPPAFSSGTVVSNITYYYDDDIPPPSSTPEEARTTSPQEVETMPGGVATFVCTNPVLACASADVNDKLPDLEVNKLAEGVLILASEEGEGKWLQVGGKFQFHGKWLRCASEGRFKGFYFPFYHPTSGGAIFKKLDGNLSPAEDLGKQARSIEMMSLTHVPPPPPHQPEVAIPIPGSVGGDEETAAAVAEDGKDIALALLASVRLDKYASAFEELGIRDVRDFFEVTDDDLTALGMSELEKRRFKSQVQSK